MKGFGKRTLTIVALLTLMFSSLVAAQPALKTNSAAEFGYSEGETVGVSTTVVASAPDIPGGRTFIAVGYPIYKAHFFKFYQKGLFSDKLLGTGTFMEPLPSSIAVTDWIQ